MHTKTFRSRVANRQQKAAYSSTSSLDLSAEFGQSWDEYKEFFHFPPASLAADFQVGQKVTVHGFLQKRRDRSSRLSFVDIVVDNGPRLQLKSEWSEKDSPAHMAHQQLKSVPAWSSVAVTAHVSSLKDGGNTGSTPSSFAGGRFPPGVNEVELELVSIQALNPWPKDIIVSDGVQFPATARHLQLRFSDTLRERMRFRQHVKSSVTACLEKENFSEVETPILFKSTPEGAREFLVPTRRPGLAYALPQSPQQYKQTLMAAGFGGYFQFARCFRDEDLRADRQPEFTQLDMEMSFATGEDVMRTVEMLIKQLYNNVATNFVQVVDTDGWHPVSRKRQCGKRGSSEESVRDFPSIDDGPLPRMSYQDVMSLYGSDKPDLRIPGQIERVEHVLPAQFVSMISEIDNPIIDCWRCTLDGGSPRKYQKFFSKILSNLPLGLNRNPDGEPVILVHDSSKPLNGFSSLGFEAAEKLTSDMQDGDVLILQARKNRPFEGGSTALGTLRSLIYNEAVAAEYIPADPSFKFLWVTGFPLFTPANEGTTDPGQGGSAGFSSTHHPFTAPLTSQDFELLATDPLRAKADHYDLVLNGCELGGGSRRIHVAHVQEFVFRSILRMTDTGVAQFRHLLEALRAGCPPHAGFALGFDRLVAMLSGTGSVRDVIAFPKSMKGEEPFAGSPSFMTEEQLETYHLRLRDGKPVKS
ncbi:hypothetical protein MCOR27_003543 [Pyricularia oryzae]|nr:hypothetical protein MCOR01_005044 [Pyricularia oryzae]KAH9431803.1 hypothetical protein MCOR02_009077 [Pyricularia oryzae]KAI6261089.1 hypothetical protein MCOR19_002631 [Pyricularia oryzae]KAI6282776.1 hypothetical protein MCOR27_003543 [Pyricularia oryzae]KAI6311891.1 hypothetical protein MCOR34_005807 [Pyricularia oryzae]